jgi:hypothetical protein
VGHRKDQDEEWAIALLERIVARDREDPDALSGEVVRLVKRALVVLKKRRKDQEQPWPIRKIH